MSYFFESFTLAEMVLNKYKRLCRQNHCKSESLVDSGELTGGVG